MYEGILKNGKKEGKGILKVNPSNKFEFKDFYECEWKDNKIFGNGKLVFRNGEIFTGVWFP